jgi:ankyrin repeat protein
VGRDKLACVHAWVLAAGSGLVSLLARIHTHTHLLTHIHTHASLSLSLSLSFFLSLSLSLSLSLLLTGQHEACHHGRVEFAERLLTHGADVNVPGDNNMTPLHDAAEVGNVAVVEVRAGLRRTIRV